MDDPRRPRAWFQRVEVLERLTVVLPAWGPALDLLASTAASVPEPAAVVIVTGEHDEVPPLPRPAEVVRIPSPTFASAVNAGVEVADRPYVAHLRAGFTYAERSGPLRLMLEMGKHPRAVAATSGSYDGRRVTRTDPGFLPHGREMVRTLRPGGAVRLLRRQGFSLHQGTIVRRDVMPRLQEGRYADWRAALEVRRAGRVLHTGFSLAERWVDFSPVQHPGPELVAGMPAHVRLAGAVARWLDRSPGAAAAGRTGRAVGGRVVGVVRWRPPTPAVVSRWREWNESHVPWLDRHPRLRLALLPSALVLAGVIVVLTAGVGPAARFVLVPALGLLVARVWLQVMLVAHQALDHREVLLEHAWRATGAETLRWPAGRLERLQGATVAAALAGLVLIAAAVVAVAAGFLP